MNTERLLEFYTLGFKDEAKVVFSDDVMQKKAYYLGRKHAEEGNDIKSLDNLNDNLVAFLIERDDIDRG